MPPRGKDITGKDSKRGQTFKKEMVTVRSVGFREVSGTEQRPLPLAARTRLVKLGRAVTTGLAHGGDGSPGRGSPVH